MQPFNGPAGEVTIPEQVHDLTLIRVIGSNDLAEAVTPVFREGKAWVPTGYYRVMSFVIGAAASDGSVVRASESIPLTQAEFTVAANQTIALTLGLPWELTIVVKPPAMRAANSSSSIMDAARSLFTASTSLRFNVQVQGPAGERFPGFYRIGGSATSRIPPPTFSIAGPDGKVLDSGSFEYG